MQVMLDGKLPARWRTPFEASFGCGLSHVLTETGAEVDAHLARAGAMALAVDAGTILLSSKLWSLPEDLRLAVIGHELAHTVQFARGRGSSSDDESLLEAEAWRAARAALGGERYRIRGRARQGSALPAVAYVMDEFGKNYFQAYKQMGFFKIAMLPITDTIVVQPMIFESIIDSMIGAFNSERYFVVWSHGNPNGFGMPLARDTTLKAHQEQLKFLMFIHEIKAEMLRCGDDLSQWRKLMAKHQLQFNPATAEEARSIMEGFIGGEVDEFAIEQKVRSAEFKKTVDRMTQKLFTLHNKKMGIIEIRACNIGANPDGLKVFRQFFGVEALGAPDLRASFGFLNPAIGFDAYKTFVEKRYPTARTSFDKLHTGRFAIKVVIAAGSTTAHIWSAATSKLTVSEWTYNYMATNINNLNHSRVPIHFLVKEPPAFQGDVDYWEHIKYAMAGNELCACQTKGPIL